MGDSIRAEVGIGSPGSCPVAAASDETDGSITGITRAAVPTDDGYTEEFTASGDDLDRERFEPVFSYDDRTVYRFDREPTADCVCTTIESFGCAVSNIHARDGRLYVAFFADGVETIQEIVSALTDTYSEVHVRQLSRTDDGGGHDFVFVDRGTLTDRQREVLETACELGYFEHPKGANAGEVAAALDIAPSTFSEHLSAAQQKVLSSLLDG